MQINWDSFKVYNQDARGIRFKFEDLCRQLFANENISGNKQFRYLHTNPNNPGLETEPIYDEKNKLWVGFQAKYFDDDSDYGQIKRSAENVVKYYTGKVDLVFLFCNKSIKSTAKGFKDTVNLLKKSNIDLQLITNDAILDLVRKKYPYLGLYYFGNHSLNQEWFKLHSSHMFKELGERYNCYFNVDTESSMELSLFVHDQHAVEYVNKKKERLLEEIEKLYYNHEKNQDYLNALRETIKTQPDINAETLYDSIAWFEKIVNAVNSYLHRYTQKLKELENSSDETYKFSIDSTQSKESRDNFKKDYEEIRRKIRNIEILLKLPSLIRITEREQQLLCNSIMGLSGRAGTGKSQLLAYETNELLKENRPALLLLAGNYFSDLPIQEQVMSNLMLDYNFEDLIDILETIGEKNNCIVPVFIDALNETWHNKLWTSNLPLIIEKINQAPMVKLVFSYRPEYEQLLFTDYIREELNNGDIVTINHRGFEINSGFAVREFLNHYNIPFSLLECFNPKMTNPLFLTLYCKTYNGEEFSFPMLYELLIKKINKNMFDILKLYSEGFSGGEDILGPLINQITAEMINNSQRLITRADFNKLNYWSEYKVAPAQVGSLLIHEGLLHNYIVDGVEYYYFAYDQMNDYYCAKAILNTYKTKTNIREYLIKNVLEIENGNICNFGNIDLFVNACALYAERFNEECIDIIDGLKENYDKEQVFARYLDSFQWRNSKTISTEVFESLLNRYPCSPDDLWPMLIGNSIKIHHPLNADFLHKFLLRYELNKRDYLWTIYINKLTLNESDRIVQLVQMYNRGEMLEIKSEKQLELLLTLFGWLLTSSNRWLRDYTSKAMIEILKNHFQLCQVVLEKFRDVNDPYVIQRLYGIVFGACCKRIDGALLGLAEYVYENIFNQENVYPDILLRDYARLIIERFFSENPDYVGIIEKEKIVPPYKSDPIPEIEDQHYEKLDYEHIAMLKLVHSMRFEGMGMYGDFGRYVFQSALRSFDVDDKKMFNYAMYYILNNLGFSEKYFGENDQQYEVYDRHITAKIERIGKKYQWISMYNMLARISDNYKMIDRWSYPEKQAVMFEGAWNPNVRDFDPTLNQNFMHCSKAPIFKQLEEHKAKGIAENKMTDYSSEKKITSWLENKGIFFKELKNTLILKDENNQHWICLTKYCDTGRKNLNIEKFLVWSWLYAYFMTAEQAKEFSECAKKGLCIINHSITSRHETYSVFNREYPWAPSCYEFEKDAWVDVQVKTGETITEKVQVPVFPKLKALFREYDGILDENKNVGNGFKIPKTQYKEENRARELEKEIGKILHATTYLLWEEEYDATKETTISQCFPCGKLIKDMELRQLEADGFFYDNKGKLVAFDTNNTQKIKSVVIRKDVLDEFLTKTGMKLVWLVDAEKEFHASNYSRALWSDWEAVFVYEGNSISGEIHRLPQTTY